MPHSPTDPITLLMTDIEGSTSLWERDLEAMNRAVERHDELVHRCVEEHGGRILKERGEGDSHFAVFERATDAVAAMLGVQRAMGDENWAVDPPLRVRAAVHTGGVFARGGDLYGPTVNRCGRLRSAAHGGQSLVSSATQRLLGEHVPEGAELRDLGQHRLKDLLRPERIFELVHAGTPPALPSIKTLNVQPHNLPIQLTSFVGRVAAIDQAREALKKHRLVTLLGPGGCGKTRLSLQAAAELVEQYPDGVWQIELALLPPKAAVSSAIASALSIQESPGLSGTEAVAEALEGKRLLLVLDNCEHVVENAAIMARKLLTSCPDVSILATSRSRLGVPGEARLPVAPLEVPDAFVEDLESLGAVESVRLFCDRAAERDPEFALSPENAEAVATLCRRLDGIPLALEFVASTVGLLGPRQILERWQNNFLVLATDDRTAVERQQTLRASIDWSVELLSPAARDLLARLSVFAGGWTLEAAESVVSGASLGRAEVLGNLGELADFSLVVTEDTPGGDKRFRFLETVRQYAGELLGEVPDDLLERYEAWGSAFAAQASEMLTGPEQARWLERVHAERSNLRKAFEGLLSKAPEQALLLAYHTRRYWVRRGPLRTGRRWFERALEAAPGAPTELRCDSLNVLGALLTYEASHDLARGPYSTSLRLAQELDDKGRIAQATTNLGISESHVENFDRALEMFEESLSAYESIGDRKGAAQARLNLGMTHLDMKRYEEAVEILSLAYEPLAEAGETSLAATCIGNRARAWAELDPLRAARDFEECLRIETEVGDPLTLARTMMRLALLGAEHGHHNLAWRTLGAIEACLRAAEVDEAAETAVQIEALVPPGADRALLDRLRSATRSLDPIEAAYVGIELCQRLRGG